jgi:hypothetical protein
MTKVATTIATLVVGQVLLASARRVAGDKVQLEFAEIIVNPKSSTNVLAELNADDDRFAAGKKGARRAYLTASPSLAEAHFGIKLADLNADGSKTEYNILNPELKGMKLRMQISEKFEGSAYEMENSQKTAKQYKDNKGVVKYFVKDGKLIFSEATMVTNEPKHKIIESDSQLTWDEYVASKVESTVESALNAE